MYELKDCLRLLNDFSIHQGGKRHYTITSSFVHLCFYNMTESLCSPWYLLVTANNVERTQYYPLQE